MPRKTAFTLIELLVVIAIIAILAAILFPVFAKAREKARQTSCASNLKQLGLSMIQYIQDYDERFPVQGSPGCGSPEAGEGYGWASLIYPYVKSTGVYACPDDTDNPGAGKSIVSYGFNADLTLNATVWTSTTNVGIMGAAAKMVAPTNTVLLFEVASDGGRYSGGIPVPATNGANDGSLGGIGISGNAGGPLGANYYGEVYGCGAPAGTYATGPTYGQVTGGAGAGGFSCCDIFPVNQTGRHTDASNWLLADGHVKWIKAGNVSGGLAAVSSSDYQGLNAGRAAGTAGALYSGGPSATATFSPT